MVVEVPMSLQNLNFMEDLMRGFIKARSQTDKSLDKMAAMSSAMGLSPSLANNMKHGFDKMEAIADKVNASTGTTPASSAAATPAADASTLAITNQGGDNATDALAKGFNALGLNGDMVKKFGDATKKIESVSSLMNLDKVGVQQNCQSGGLLVLDNFSGQFHVACPGGSRLMLI